jgi:hypothetical protein
MEIIGKEIREAIVRCNKAQECLVNSISRATKMSPHLVQRHFDGSALSLFELKQFSDWKGRLPNDEETIQVLHYGVGAMKKLFKQTN